MAAVAAVAASARAHDALHVPSLDFHAMAFDTTLVRSLQAHGIVTIKNVPGYAARRSEYLRTAAKCVWQRRAPGAYSGILQHTLADGTQRLTISSIGGLDGLAPGDCPEYQQRKQQFSDVVARAIDTLGAAFDASLAAAVAAHPDQSLHALVSEADVIDHFHAYVPVPSTAATATETDHDAAFALNMHSDSGVFIAMSAPAFFRVGPSASSASAPLLQEIANPDPAAGLFIKLRNGTVVRPVQPAEELTVMIGEGFASWTQLPVAIPAVVHGMRMPQTCRADAPVLRTWFGKMVLLPAAAAMRNTGVTFAAYSRALGELAQQQIGSFPAHFAAAACPASPSSGGQQRQRQLAVGACEYRLCHPFSTDVKREQCAYWCNSHTMSAGFDFAALCKANCLCSHHTLTSGTYRCWMSCFEVDETCTKHNSCRDLVLGDNVVIPQRTCSDTPPLVTDTTALRMRVKVTVVRSEAEVGESDSDESNDDSSDSV